MGVLLGGFIKQMAGMRMNRIQLRMAHIQSAIRRVHRESEQMGKAIEREKKSILNQLKCNNDYAIQFANQKMESVIGGTLASLGATDPSKLDEGKQTQFNQSWQYAQMLMSQEVATANMNYEQQKNRIEQQFEEYKTNCLEPLNDEEEELKEENETLKVQYDLASQEYKSAQEMEKNDAKMLAPGYTGSASA